MGTHTHQKEHRKQKMRSRREKEDLFGAVRILYRKAATELEESGRGRGGCEQKEST